jgi:hypothetical protein
MHTTVPCQPVGFFGTLLVARRGWILCDICDIWILCDTMRYPAIRMPDAVIDCFLPALWLLIYILCTQGYIVLCMLNPHHAYRVVWECPVSFPDNGRPCSFRLRFMELHWLVTSGGAVLWFCSQSPLNLPPPGGGSVRTGKWSKPAS